MSKQAETPVTKQEPCKPETLPSLVYKRVGGAAAGVEDFVGDYVISTNHEGTLVSVEPLRPDVRADFKGQHTFPVMGLRESARHARVTRVDVYYSDMAGNPQNPITLNGDEHDAFFWSRSALRKFVAPYYCALLGPDEANRVLQSWEENPEKAGVCHTPLSLPCSAIRDVAIQCLETLVQDVLTPKAGATRSSGS